MIRLSLGPLFFSLFFFYQSTNGIRWSPCFPYFLTISLINRISYYYYYFFGTFVTTFSTF